MDGSHNPVAQAVEELQRASEGPPVAELEVDDLVVTLADLSRIAVQVGELAEQLRMLLADRPTVTAHLRQAQDHGDDLRRTLDHAAGTLAYNTGRTLPLAA